MNGRLQSRVRLAMVDDAPGTERTAESVEQLKRRSAARIAVATTGDLPALPGAATPQTGIKTMRSNGNLLVGFAAGAVGGFAGSWVTNRFHHARRALMPGVQRGEGQSYVAAPGRSSGQGEQLSQETSGQEVNAAAQLAERVARPLLCRSLTRDEKELGGAVMHYGFGAVAGGIYGILAEIMPRLTVGRGVPFGAVVFLIAEEGAMPALGVTPPRTELPASAHGFSLAAHFLYGLTVEAIRRTFRSHSAR